MNSTSNSNDQTPPPSLARVMEEELLDYSRRRLGPLQEDPWIQQEIRQRIEIGWEPHAAIDDVSHRGPGRLLDWLLERAGSSARILDWGCGDGSMANFERDYDSLSNPVISVDLHEPAVEFPSHAMFYSSDLNEFIWEGPLFDIGLAVHVFEHIPEPLRVAKRFRALLRPGGYAYVAIPESRWFHDILQHVWGGEECDHVNAFTFDSFTALMEEADFSLVTHTLWPAHFTLMYGMITFPDGRNLGEILDQVAHAYDRVHGGQSMTCYGYAMVFRAGPG